MLKLFPNIEFSAPKEINLDRALVSDHGFEILNQDLLNLKGTRRHPSSLISKSVIEEMAAKRYIIFSGTLILSNYKHSKLFHQNYANFMSSCAAGHDTFICSTSDENLDIFLQMINLFEGAIIFSPFTPKTNVLKFKSPGAKTPGIPILTPNSPEADINYFKNNKWTRIVMFGANHLSKNAFPFVPAYESFFNLMCMGRENNTPVSCFLKTMDPLIISELYTKFNLNQPWFDKSFLIRKAEISTVFKLPKKLSSVYLTNSLESLSKVKNELPEKTDLLLFHRKMVSLNAPSEYELEKFNLLSPDEKIYIINQYGLTSDGSELALSNRIKFLKYANETVFHNYKVIHMNPDSLTGDTSVAATLGYHFFETSASDFQHFVFYGAPPNTQCILDYIEAYNPESFSFFVTDSVDWHLYDYISLFTSKEQQKKYWQVLAVMYNDWIPICKLKQLYNYSYQCETNPPSCLTCVNCKADPTIMGEVLRDLQKLCRVISSGDIPLLILFQILQENKVLGAARLISYLAYLIERDFIDFKIRKGHVEFSFKNSINSLFYF